MRRSRWPSQNLLKIAGRITERVDNRRLACTRTFRPSTAAQRRKSSSLYVARPICTLGETTPPCSSGLDQRESADVDPLGGGRRQPVRTYARELTRLRRRVRTCTCASPSEALSGSYDFGLLDVCLRDRSAIDVTIGAPTTPRPAVRHVQRMVGHQASTRPVHSASWSDQ